MIDLDSNAVNSGLTQVSNLNVFDLNQAITSTAQAGAAPAT